MLVIALKFDSMLRRHLLYSSLTLITLCSHNVAMAQDGAVSDKFLKGRDELKTKLGSERSIVSNEIWAPLWQSQDGVGTDKVVYGDLRLMGDDQDNREFNLGVGYRTLVPEETLILGGHAWFDRRTTEMGSTFNQMTLGGEILREDWDFRGNMYVPLSEKESYLTGSVATVDPYLAGTGIYYNTGGNTYLVEEPQPGFDLEIGTRLPFLDGVTDQTRAYAGMYHFKGDTSQSVTGWRTRIASDVTQDIQLGARVQQDDVRGMQGFFEATIRFPFGNKKSYKEHGLRSRLDESPERDVDIVTGSANVAPQLEAALNRDTGTVQRIIHVDNTAASGGDGSLEHPYNTLADVQVAVQRGDTVYIHSGAGSMDGGLSIVADHIQIIGEGSAFAFDNDRFIAGTTSSSFNGFILRAAGAAPTITNTMAGGNGVSITGDEIELAGFNVDGAQGSGISLNSTSNADASDFDILNVNASNNGAHGIIITVNAGGRIDDATITNATTDGNAASGIRVEVAGSSISQLTIQNSTTTNNGNRGVYVRSIGTGASIETANITNITNTGNITGGVMLISEVSGQIDTANLSYITGTGNGKFGTRVSAQNNGRINAARLSHITSSNTSGQGVYVAATTGGIIASADLSSITSSGNTGTTGRGIQISANDAGSSIGTVTLSNSSASNNTGQGVFVSTSSSGVISSAGLSNITSTNNTGTSGRGIQIQSTDSASLNSTVSNSTVSGNALQGFYAVSNTSGNLSASLERVTSTGNTGNGVYIDDDTDGTFVVDLGGGALGSTGFNEIYSNTNREIRVDLDGGQLKAENNWWGVGTGLAGGETTLNVGSTIDANPFLGADPTP